MKNLAGTYRRVGRHVASERGIVCEAPAADGAVVRLAGKFQPTPGMQEWVELVILRTVQIDEAEVRISDSKPRGAVVGFTIKLHNI